MFKSSACCFLNIWIFSFSTLTIFQCLLASSIFVEKLTVNFIVTRLRMIICLFSLWLFLRFSLCLWCAAVYYVPRYHFLLFVLCGLHPFKILDLCLMSFFSSEKFLVVISSAQFSPSSPVILVAYLLVLFFFAFLHPLCLLPSHLYFLSFCLSDFQTRYFL